MKLFTKYNRINLVVMVIIFLLSSCTYYFILNYVLNKELNEDMKVIQYKIQLYAATYHQLPTRSKNIDDEQISYTLTNQKDIPQRFEVAKEYDSHKGKNTSFKRLIFGLQAGDNQYIVSINKSTESTDRLLRIIAFITIGTILMIIISSLLINRVVLRKLWLPFYEAMAIIKDFKIGKKQALIFPKTTTEEFVFMNNNLQQTTLKAESDYLLLREFTENASHEIQTPLAIVRSKLDILIQDEQLTEQQSKTLLSAYAGIRKLSQLNQSLLLLTKIDNEQFTDIMPVNLLEKIQEKTEQFHELWLANNIRTTFQLENACINANNELIDILLNNLLSNASKHNTPNGSIHIQLQPQSLVISNTGPDHSLNHFRLFKRFYKEEQHSNNNGLGLSIVKQICETSGITVVYQFTEGRHSFCFSW